MEDGVCHLCSNRARSFSGTLFSILETEASIDMANQTNPYVQNATTDVYKQAQELENKILDRALDIKPTIKVKEGTEIKLITNVTMDIPPLDPYPVEQRYIREY